jgi:hypothetical protein
MWNLGIVLLAVWLILMALLALLNASFPGSALVLNILALAAGIFLLFNRAGRGPRRGWPDNLGIILLAVWLILMALVSLLGATLPGIGIVLNVLALAAGIFLLVRR